MRRLTMLLTVVIPVFASIVLAQSAGPYKVLKTAKVGGEGGTDYIFADTVGRRLYITRGATQAREATATTPAVPAFEKRLTIFDLDTLEPAGVIPGVGGNGGSIGAIGYGFDNSAGAGGAGGEGGNADGTGGSGGNGGAGTGGSTV